MLCGWLTFVCMCEKTKFQVVSNHQNSHNATMDDITDYLTLHTLIYISQYRYVQELGKEHVGRVF